MRTAGRLKGIAIWSNTDDELESTLGIAQAVMLSGVLGAALSEITGKSVGSAPVRISAVRARMADQLGRWPEAREALEDLIDWDLGPF